MSERTYTDDELDSMKAENRTFQYEGKEYDGYTATQKQRQIERTLRKLKRERSSYKAAGLTDEYNAVNAKIRRLTYKYRQFSKKAGLPEQRERTKVQYTDDETLEYMQGISEEGADSPPFPEWATSDGGVLPLDNSFNDNPFPCFRSNALFNFSTSFDVTTNARMKKYLNKAVVQVANADVFPACNYELYDSKIADKRKRSYDVPPKGQAVNPQRALEESQRRAASKIRDIALCNHFTHFFTWTLSSDMIDRYDVQEIYKKLRVFCLMYLVERIFNMY